MLHETLPVEEKDLLDQNVTTGDDDQGGQDDETVLALLDNESILSEEVLAELNGDAFSTLERMGGSSLASSLKDAAKNISDQGQLRSMVREALGRVQHDSIAASADDALVDAPHEDSPFEDNIVEFVAKPVAEAVVGSVQVLSDVVLTNAVPKKAPVEQSPISDVTEAVLKTVERIVASPVIVPVKQIDVQDNKIEAVLVQPAVQQEIAVDAVKPLAIETVAIEIEDTVEQDAPVLVVAQDVADVLPVEKIEIDTVEHVAPVEMFVAPVAVSVVAPQVVKPAPTMTSSYTVTETIAVAPKAVIADGVQQDVVVEVTQDIIVETPVDVAVIETPVVAKQGVFSAFIEQEKTLLDVVAPSVVQPVVEAKNEFVAPQEIKTFVPAVANVVSVETSVDVVSDVSDTVEQDIVATIQEPVADVFVTEDEVTIVVEEVSVPSVEAVVQDAVEDIAMETVEAVVDAPVEVLAPKADKVVEQSEKENAASVVAKQVDVDAPVQKVVVEKTAETVVEEPQTLLNVFAQSFDTPEQKEEKEKEFANNATSKGIMQDVFAPEAVERDYFATLMSAMSRYP